MNLYTLLVLTRDNLSSAFQLDPEYLAVDPPLIAFDVNLRSVHEAHVILYRKSPNEFLVLKDAMGFFPRGGTVTTKEGKPC